MILYSNGDVFEYQNYTSIDKQLNGNGIFKFANGMTYKGSITNGQLDGKGQLYQDNYTAEGEWQAGKVVGDKIWKIKYLNTTYEGQVNEQLQKNGQGIYKSDTTTYDGQWKDDNMNGQGQLISDNFKYTGIFVAGKFQGQGQYSTSSMNYNGEFNDNKFDGFGILEFKNQTYEGYFKNGKKCGKGTLKYKSLTMEGYWFDDQMQGLGKISDKFVYEGEFVDSLPNGQGVLKIDGLVYTGYFDSGRFDGQGRIQTSEYDMRGTFIDNYANGDCEIVFPDGAKLQVQLEDNKKNGICTLFTKKVIYRGYFRNNIEDLDKCSYK
ncbi:hypothetical protein pb186bvf_002603 [Paramecium bursaria]